MENHLEKQRKVQKETSRGVHDLERFKQLCRYFLNSNILGIRSLRYGLRRNVKKETLSIFSCSHFSLEMTYYLMSCLVARTTGFCLCSTFSARSRQLLENNFLLPPLTLLGSDEEGCMHSQLVSHRGQGKLVHFFARIS